MAKNYKKSKYASLDITDEERQRRSELAKQMHEQGKFGGKQPGAGRPRKRRVTEVLNEKIEGDANLIYERLKESLDSESEVNKLKAIQIMLDTAKSEMDYQQKEKRNLEDMSEEDLIALIASGVGKLNEGGELPFDFDTTAEEIIEPAELEEGSDGSI